MLITIEFDAQEPIYQQIRTQIVRAVATGELTAGDSLPSVRALAADLGINLHTVNKAYALLRDEGFVVMNRRRGAVIADRLSARTPEARRQELDAIGIRIRDLAVEHKAQGGSGEEFLTMAAEAIEWAYGAKKPSAAQRKGE